MELNLPVADSFDPDFRPTALDVRATRILLQHVGLPTELILLILDFARYWTSCTTFRASKLCLLDWNHDLNHSSTVAYLSAPVSLRPTSTGETPKIREIEFCILSHDQGWTSEFTQNKYKTSSWFEVSIVRGSPSRMLGDSTRTSGTNSSCMPRNVAMFADVERARAHCKYVEFVRRPDEGMEEQRTHCREMIRVFRDESQGEMPLEEGMHAWWLQGNRVVTATGDPDRWARRENAVENRVKWGCRAAPAWEGNEGAGKGEGFVDSLKDGDCVVLWARVKRRGWENHVYEASISVRYTMGPSGTKEVKAERY
ncbi:uncharacterized protein CC84DRAFT_1145151 [Paraphaeosphaeria sporulosa]|uniref:Uncharacterized protein n=1 Tax=Paraphaeosphaeria sporulosa TaxID=1460663 RepID=A0A177CFJ6_9PLEO|nr:uncharacterized protein CC84DRAFT_1145151 [Paraphaeosphaeria sporulosa]OAG05619.1 hypothetical protein CC84DRAFT_1145151 [Paraphaeosphaeria sporulosa]